MTQVAAALVLALGLAACGNGGTADSIDRLTAAVGKSNDATIALTVRVAALEDEVHALKGMGACIPPHDAPAVAVAAAAPPPPPSLAITSAPTGATVTVDGAVAGETPLQITPGKPRVHVEIAKPGYVTVARDVDLGAKGDRASLSVSLTPQ